MSSFTTQTNVEKKKLSCVTRSHKSCGRPLSGHEILIDIPGFNKSPEVDLKVFYGPESPSEKVDPLTFDDPEVTRLRDSLLDNFEDQAKIFRIFCIDDPQLRTLVRNEAKRHLN